MDTNIIAVLLSFGLYILYVTLPMIPAVLIYRLFPDTKVAVSGPLANLTMKASGAFAGYVIVVALGFFLVKNTHAIIAGIAQPTWTIKAKVELRDKDGKRIDDNKLLKFVEVYLEPDPTSKEGNFIKLHVPGTGTTLPDYLVNFKIQKFGEQTIDTSDLDGEEIEEDKFHRVLKIIKPIEIQQTLFADAPYEVNNYLQPGSSPGSNN